MWLGYEDSNLGMPESESGALPLGDTPIVYWLSLQRVPESNRSLTAWRYPNCLLVISSACAGIEPMPYSLEIPQLFLVISSARAGIEPVPYSLEIPNCLLDLTPTPALIAMNVF